MTLTAALVSMWLVLPLILAQTSDVLPAETGCQCEGQITATVDNLLPGVKYGSYCMTTKQINAENPTLLPPYRPPLEDRGMTFDDYFCRAKPGCGTPVVIRFPINVTGCSVRGHSSTRPHCLHV